MDLSTLSSVVAGLPVIGTSCPIPSMPSNSRLIIERSICLTDESPFHLLGTFPGPVSLLHRRLRSHPCSAYPAATDTSVIRQVDTPYEGGHYEVDIIVPDGVRSPRSLLIVDDND